MHGGPLKGDEIYLGDKERAKHTSIQPIDQIEQKPVVR